MNVLVTGGAGFIGANLCRALAGADEVDRVVVLDDLSTGTRSNLDGVSGVEFLEGSILDSALLDRALSGIDAVVHLAAIPSVPRSLDDPVASHQANATGTLAVLEAVRRLAPAGRPHVIVASSSSVYGANPTLPKIETMAARPLSPYAVSKLATESYALAYAASFNLDVLVFRFFNVFGPLQGADHAYAAVIPAFVAAARAGTPLPVNGDGTQTRDFTYVATVTDVLLDALRRRVTHEIPVNLAFGSRVSLLELVRALEAVVGRPLSVEHRQDRPGDVAHSQADQSLLRSLFPGVEPVPLAQGLERVSQWFASLPA